MPWIVRECTKDDGERREIHVDGELTRAFAGLLGQSLDDMLGAGFGASFPLNQERFAKLREIFAFDPAWDDAEWFLEETRKGPSD